MIGQALQTITMNDGQYVLVPADRYDHLIERLGADANLDAPALPEKNEQGHKPAKQTMLALMARKLIRRRAAAGLTQQELSQRAGVRAKTISRFESGKHRANRPTIVKIDDALLDAGV